MACEYQDGFDLFNTAQISRYYPGATGSNSIVTGLTSPGNAFQCGGSSSGTVTITSRSTYVFGYDFKTQLGNEFFFEISHSSGTILCDFRATSAGQITTTFGNSSAGVILANTVQQIQIKLVVHTVTGELVVKVDGVTVINLTNINTGSNNVTGFRFKHEFGGGGTTNIFDSLWVLNVNGSHSNGFPTGRMSILTLYPNADGTYSDLTPNSGSVHYDRVDETPADDDTTYNSSATAGNKDTYNTENLTGTINQIHALRLVAVMKKTDVDTKIVHSLIKSSATLNESADIDVPANYTPEYRILDDDPNTSAQWTETNVNAIEVGLKIIS